MVHNTSYLVFVVKWSTHLTNGLPFNGYPFNESVTFFLLCIYSVVPVVNLVSV